MRFVLLLKSNASGTGKRATIKELLLVEKNKEKILYLS